MCIRDSQDVTHDRPIDLQSHQPAQIVPVGQLILFVFVRTQERQRRGLLCAFPVQIVRVEQVDAALCFLVTAPEPVSYTHLVFVICPGYH